MGRLNYLCTFQTNHKLRVSIHAFKTRWNLKVVTVYTVVKVRLPVPVTSVTKHWQRSLTFVTIQRSFASVTIQRSSTSVTIQRFLTSVTIQGSLTFVTIQGSLTFVTIQRSLTSVTIQIFLTAVTIQRSQPL